MSIGFDWGYQPVASKPVAKIAAKPITKRRHDDEHTSRPSSHTHRIIKHKRSKQTFTQICGQQLPLPRLLELLSADQLKTLVGTLVSIHPEISGTIVATTPKPTVIQLVTVLQEKLDAVWSSMPYQAAHTAAYNEYAYNRVKPLIGEFLSTLSDYVLSMLPPIEQYNHVSSLQFLDSITEMIHRLPDFESALNNHHKNISYEQIDKVWCLVLKAYCIMPADGNMQLWYAKLNKHNEQSMGRLGSSLEYLRDEIDHVDCGLAVCKGDALSVRV